MKKLVNLLVFTLVSAPTFARTCPAGNDLYYRDAGGTYRVNAPAGWNLVRDSRENKYIKANTFRVAAWGDHKHTTDNVRCYYYADNLTGWVQLETNELMDESHVSSWRDTTPLYDLCVSLATNVNDCSFT